MPVGKTRDTEAQRVREKQRGTERYRVGQEAAGTQPQTCPDGRARDGRPVPPGEKQRQERYGVVKKQDPPVRFRAHSLTHGARAILLEAVALKRIRRKTGARHECKIAYSWPALSDVEGRAGRMTESWVPRLRRLQSCRAPAPASSVPAGRPRARRDYARILLLMARGRF